ncbi:hypothetical protein Vi05172_g13499 [Venturia inaequalis]|nr:hypothetical protein Vi05172_g13499 [Venturia inaequalis]
MTISEISTSTKVSVSQIGAICRYAKTQGWDPKKKGPILNEYVARKEGSGGVVKLTPEKLEAIAGSVETDRFGAEKTTRVLATEHDISQTLIVTAMARMGFRKTKPTTKPGLNTVQKQQRLAFCLAHRDWTLEQWKDVIWSDETSVVLGVRRGGQRV